MRSVLRKHETKNEGGRDRDWGGSKGIVIGVTIGSPQINRRALGARMDVVDKTGCLARALAGEKFSLELGCGPNKRNPQALGVDVLDVPGVDLVGDVFDVLGAFPAGSVSAVYTYHFLEHVADLTGLLREVARVLDSNGKFEVEVPHFSNPYYYSDPTHVRPFGLYTFAYLAQTKLFKRALPTYAQNREFVLEDVTLQFHSPFLFRKIVRRLVGPLFNLTRWLQEFHEENLCYLFPAYQIRFELRRL
jgi:SAM-dependent methyltransferase